MLKYEKGQIDVKEIRLIVPKNDFSIKLNTNKVETK